MPRPGIRRASAERVHSLHLASAAAAGATVALAVATRTARLQALDDAFERAMAPRRPALRRLARAATLPGERFGHPTIGAAVALALLSRRGGAPGRVLVPLACASAGAIASHFGVKFFYRRARPRVALARGKYEPAYPSGHAADATAVLLTGAYLLARERLVPARVGLPVACALAAATGWSRVALGWHWSTDVAGGWLTGVAVAAACAAEYERRIAPPQSGDRSPRVQSIRRTSSIRASIST